MVSFQIGLVGKPNVGKSTLFSALTSRQVSIANYPFTTVSPNRGMGYVKRPCPHVILGKNCNPQNSGCYQGTRLIPVELIDVAGLVPDAHLGRGLGNRFLDDLRTAKTLIHIVDVSGSTDSEGNMAPVASHDPQEDVNFLETEISYWIKDILEKNFKKIARKIESENLKIETALAEQLSGLGIKEKEIALAVKNAYLGAPSGWEDEEYLRLAREILRLSKPIIIAANKADLASKEQIDALLFRTDYRVIPISAEYELVLQKASAAGLIEYIAGGKEFKIKDPSKLTERQTMALNKISEFMNFNNGTGVQRLLETVVFDTLKFISVYPVEDENKWTDKKGNVLPDAYLVKDGSNALDLAFMVHTDLGSNFIRAIDAKTKKIIGHDHVLKDGDVIKIIAKT